jgi:FkbM family methyltransferase
MPVNRSAGSLKRRVLMQMDVPVGRRLLGWIATRHARRVLGRRDVAVDFRDLWMHRVGEYAVPDGPRFDYETSRILKWNDQVAKYLRNAEDYWFRHYTASPGDVIVDVGAGRGEDVLAFSQRVGPTGRVVAIEAHPGSFRLLQKFCTLNHLDNVIPVNAALMDAPGFVTIETSDDWRANTVGAAPGGSRIAATTLDLLADELHLEQIAFVKMNIEGAEQQALRGMDATLARTSHVCVCCHDFRAERGDGEEYRTGAFTRDFLTRRGFVVHDRPTDPRPYVRDHVHGVRQR